MFLEVYVNNFKRKRIYKSLGDINIGSNFSL